MTTRPLRQVLEVLRGSTLPQGEAGLTDGQLLERYIRSREEVAFATLVQRHGPMVWGVCRRILPGYQDAEDAFQATFLVLVRRATSIVPREMVANWLYGVAHQTALKARATFARRREREKQVLDMPEPTFEPQPCDDLRALLDQELSQLPDKYRAVLILCDLQGKTRKEAARHLSWPEGTVGTRLATARTMLARRLTRRGHPITDRALAAGLLHTLASPSVPLSVMSATIEAATLFAAGQAATGVISVQAVALAEGVLATMTLSKFKIATVLLIVLTVFGAGAVALTRPQPADTPQPAPRNPDPANPPGQKIALAVAPESISGVVTAVDVQKNTLTVTHREGAGTFTLARDARIEVDGKLGNLAWVPVGANVNLTKFVDPTTASQLQANGRWYFGASVKAVDPRKRTITIADREGDRTFSVADDACLSVDGKPCDLTRIPAGAFVNLGLRADQATACNIGADGPHLGGCGGSPVKAVDTVNFTITFEDKASNDVAGKTFAVARDAAIQIEGKPGTLAGVPPGAYANITLTVDQTMAHHLTVQGPPAMCDCNGSLVKAVDVANSTLTFADSARADVAGKTFRIAKDAIILIDNKAGTLAGIPPGSYVDLRLSLDRSEARRLTAIGPMLNSVKAVKVVDVEKHLLTVEDATYPVARDANIVVDGKPATLAEVPTGIFVTLRLCVDQKTVGTIHHAKGP
jgi:RNA polymerase sigma factor (sigma-70 family)